MWSDKDIIVKAIKEFLDKFPAIAIRQENTS